jgi:hypothetical protein
MATDPLFAASSLVVSILGIPVTFETDAAEILEAIKAAYDPADIMSPGAGRGPRVRVEATTDFEATWMGEPTTVQLPEWHRLVVRWGGGEARADAIRGQALARVGRGAAGAAGFREGVLDHLALFLVTNLDRHPLHAAGIERDGKAVLLVGSSGLGKSSLTYAAMRAGWRVLADDAVYVQRSPRRRLWGVPRRIHLTADAVRHFPELEGASLERRTDGRRKIAVEIAAPSRASMPWSGDVGLCLLSRSSAHAAPERLSAAEAVREMRGTLQGGFERFAESLDECVASLSTGGTCWRVPVTAEPAELARRVEELFREAP